MLQRSASTVSTELSRNSELGTYAIVSAQPLRKTLTYNQGKEMALHKQLTINTGIAVYFCDPPSPWQRGSNENTNRLVR